MVCSAAIRDAIVTADWFLDLEFKRSLRHNRRRHDGHRTVAQQQKQIEAAHRHRAKSQRASRAKARLLCGIAANDDLSFCIFQATYGHEGSIPFTRLSLKVAALMC